MVPTKCSPNHAQREKRHSRVGLPSLPTTAVSDLSELCNPIFYHVSLHILKGTLTFSPLFLSKVAWVRNICVVRFVHKAAGACSHPPWLANRPTPPRQVRTRTTISEAFLVPVALLRRAHLPFSPHRSLKIPHHNPQQQHKSFYPPALLPEM